MPEVQMPEIKFGTYAIPLAIIWTSLAIGVGYNTWKAHEAYYEAQRTHEKIEILDRQWDKTEKRVNRRIDYQNNRLKAIESHDRAK